MPPAYHDEYQFTAEFYDSLTPYRNRRDVDFYVHAAREAGGGVLEIGCGTGRVLIPTAQAGARITGLDGSEAMLAQCRAKLAGEPDAVQRRVRLMPGDMRDFDLGEKFNLITIPFRPFQHLVTAEEQMACLASIRRHLAPGGKLIFDLFNPWLEYLTDPKRFQEIEDVPELSLPGGRTVRRCSRVSAHDYSRQVQDIELIYYVAHPDGRGERLVHVFPMRYFFRYEVEHLLAQSGFAVEAVYADFDKSPFGAKYPGEIITVAKPT